MHPRLVFVDLPKDRRPEVYRFRPPRCGILGRSKPSGTRVEVDCPKLVTDLGRPRLDVVETEVTHGRGTPLTSQSPRPFLLSEPARNSNCDPMRGVNARLARSSPWRPSAPARNGAGAPFSGPHCRASRAVIRARMDLRVS